MTLRLILTLCLAGLVASIPTSKVHPALRNTLESSETANIFVKFRGGNHAALRAVESHGSVSREQRITYLVDELKSLVKSSQKNAVQLLQTRTSTPILTQFWITNELYVKGADVFLVKQLADLPEVSEIYEEEILKVPGTGQQASLEKADDPGWNIEKIEADKAWTIPGGNSGQGIVVASVDSGVRHTHEALRGNFRSSKGWYDPQSNSQIPEDVDPNGKGTLAMSVAVGSNGIGVAPGAQWIACKACWAADSCTLNEIKKCGEFVMCPTDPDGQNENCSMAAHVVINGYGEGQGQVDLDDMFTAWTTAGIIPVFGVGESNTHWECRTVLSYGDSKYVIGVGSTNSSDGSVPFAARGPAIKGDVGVKPDITGPGDQIRTAGASSDTEYKIISTSRIAASHVAGGAALLLSGNPELTFEGVKTFLFNNSERKLVDTGLNCGGIQYPQFPNNDYGHGRLNVRLALEAVINNRTLHF